MASSFTMVKTSTSVMVWLTTSLFASNSSSNWYFSYILRLFQSEEVRHFHHQIVEIFAYFPRVSLQNFTCLAHVFLIFLIALLVDAGCSAVVDMILQTRLVSAFCNAFSGDRHSAGAGLIKLLDDL